MRRQIIGLLAAGLITAFAAADAWAIEIASRTGAINSINVNPAGAIQFTTSDIFENVTIEALVGSAHSTLPGSGTVYLTTSAGPGTTVADELARVSLSNIARANAATPLMLLFSGLTLAPDTYYLFLASDVGNPGIGWGANFSPATVAGPGVTVGADLVVGVSTPLASYSPATASFSTSGERLFRVTGDLVAVPEPATLALLASGGVLVLAAGRRRRR